VRIHTVDSVWVNSAYCTGGASGGGAAGAGDGGDDVFQTSDAADGRVLEVGWEGTRGRMGGC
jgi:hypothetical protein